MTTNSSISRTMAGWRTFLHPVLVVQHFTVRLQLLIHTIVSVKEHISSASVEKKIRDRTLRLDRQRSKILYYTPSTRIASLRIHYPFGIHLIHMPTLGISNSYSISFLSRDLENEFDYNLFVDLRNIPSLSSQYV